MREIVKLTVTPVLVPFDVFFTLKFSTATSVPLICWLVMCVYISTAPVSVPKITGEVPPEAA